MMKDNNLNNLPRDLKLVIIANSLAMKNFYSLSHVVRERVLASVSNANKQMAQYRHQGQ